jgi:alkanesulfonate monooxygenase SsuD/methylene tetrahydromethanopterin reductase-like flavin-dependent oxidoreductase (luciferase family)
MRDSPAHSDADLAVERCLERLVIAGTPDSVAQQIVAFRDEAGEFGTLLYTGHDWVEPALARRSMELMATEVMPRVQSALQQAGA